MKTLSLSKKKHPLFSDYCQFLLASFHNFTQTYFAEHTDRWSHDPLNRLLREERISAGDLWRSVRNDIDFDPDGYLLFDDTVVSKPYAQKMESVRRQWSGSEKRVIEGIGLVTCVYVNPKTQAYWIIDYRIYDVDRDGKTKKVNWFISKSFRYKWTWRVVMSGERTNNSSDFTRQRRDNRAAECNDITENA